MLDAALVECGRRRAGRRLAVLVRARSGGRLRSGGQAIDGERGVGSGVEGADQVANRQVGGHCGDHDADDHLAVNARAGRAGQARRLQGAEARLIGVARRNARRATSSWSSPRRRLTAIHALERLIPPGRAAIRSSPRRPLPVGQGGDAGVGVPGGGEIEDGPATAVWGSWTAAQRTVVTGSSQSSASPQADRHADGIRAGPQPPD